MYTYSEETKMTSPVLAYRGAWMYPALNKHCKVKSVAFLSALTVLLNRKMKTWVPWYMEFKMSITDFSVVKPAVLLVVYFGMVHNPLNQRKYSVEKMLSIPKKYPLEVKKIWVNLAIEKIFMWIFFKLVTKILWLFIAATCHSKHEQSQTMGFPQKFCVKKKKKKRIYCLAHFLCYSNVSDVG